MTIGQCLLYIYISKFIYKCFIRNIYVITIQNFIPFCLLKFTTNFTNISIRNNSLFVTNRVIFVASERRRERYLIIYTWRIMEGQVPNISEPNRGGINLKWHIRRGRVCIVPTVNNQSSGSLRSLYTTPALPFMVLNFSTPCQQQFAI